MRILYICADTGIDVLGQKGASVHVREMIAAFTRAGHEVELVAPRLTKPGANPARIEATVHRVRVNDTIQRAKATVERFTAAHIGESSVAKDLRRILYDDELNTALLERFSHDPPDLIYVRASLLSTAGVELARATQRPLVVELNAPLASEQRHYRAGALAELSATVEASVLCAATAVVVVSEALIAHVAALGAEPTRIHLCPNGVDPERFRPGFVSVHRRSQLGIPSGVVLGFVGGLRPWHGAEQLPAILARVRAAGVDADLVIAGDGPMRDDIIEHAETLGIADHVVLLGSIDHDDVADVIRCCTVALAPYRSLQHDFYFSPLKVYEYLACAVPVVASAVGQIASTLVSGVHAMLADPGDVDAAAKACLSLIADQCFAARLAACGADLVRQHYTWDRNAAAVCQLAKNR